MCKYFCIKGCYNFRYTQLGEDSLGVGFVSSCHIICPQLAKVPYILRLEVCLNNVSRLVIHEYYFHYRLKSSTYECFYVLQAT